MFLTSHMMANLRKFANENRSKSWGLGEHLAWHRGCVAGAALVEAKPGNDADDLAYLAAMNEARFLTTTYQRS